MTETNPASVRSNVPEIPDSSPTNIHPIFARLLMPVRPRVTDADDEARMDAEDQKQAADKEAARAFEPDPRD